MKFSPSRSAPSVELRPSRAIYLTLIALALGAIAATLVADLPRLWRIGAVIGELGYTGYCLRQQARQRGRLQWREGWRWQPHDGIEQLLQLQSATVWPGLIVLVFRDAVARRSLTLALWRDSLDADAARRLRVVLRHSPVFGE